MKKDKSLYQEGDPSRYYDLVREFHEKGKLEFGEAIRKAQGVMDNVIKFRRKVLKDKNA